MSPLFTILPGPDTTLSVVAPPIIWLSPAVTGSLSDNNINYYFPVCTAQHWTSWWLWCDASCVRARLNPSYELSITTQSVQPVTWPDPTLGRELRDKSSHDKLQKLNTCRRISVQWNVQLANPDLSIETINNVKLTEISMNYVIACSFSRFTQSQTMNTIRIFDLCRANISQRKWANWTHELQQLVSSK